MAAATSRAERRGEPTWPGGPSVCQCRRDLRAEARALLGFVEHVETTAVEDEMERAVGRRRCEKIHCREAAAQFAALHFAAGPFDRERREIDAQHIEAMFRQPNCVGPGPRADFKGSALGERQGK